MGEIERVIQVMVRKGEESVEQFQTGGRTDLVEKEKKEIEILKSFLPHPLSQEEILKIIDQSIQETQASSPKDIGKVMKSVMPKMGGESRRETDQPVGERKAFPINSSS